MIEPKAIAILQFLAGLRGDLHDTLEEGTSSAWLYDLIQPHVTEVVVCDPRQNALLNHGNKSDRIDARKLADLLRSNRIFFIVLRESSSPLPCPLDHIVEFVLKLPYAGHPSYFPVFSLEIQERVRQLPDSGAPALIDSRTPDFF